MSGEASSAMVVIKYIANVTDVTGKKVDFAMDSNVPTKLFLQATIGKDVAANRQILTWLGTTATKALLDRHGPFVCSADDSQCKRPATSFTMNPMSWLHQNPPVVHDPLCIPVCARPACQVTAERQCQEIMNDMRKDQPKMFADPSNSPNPNLNRITCANCKQARTDSKPLNRCSRCQLARYCSKECQRTHWPAHKPRCIPAKK